MLSELAIFSLILALFAVKLANYADPAALRPSTIADGYRDVVSAISNLPILASCTSGLTVTGVPGGYVCTHGPSRGLYDQIYRTYPLVGRGRESIYPATDEGSIRQADDLLRNKWDIPRYPPLRLPGLPSWSENAHKSVYWRFEFYSLRATSDLLYAFRSTGRPEYATKLLAIARSFIAAEPRSSRAWADPHAVAFRSMQLVDAWWKLRQLHKLPEAASSALLAELDKTGRYLADPNHYQPEDNHGANESAALLELAVAFPTLPQSHAWLALGRARLRWQLHGNFDAAGQLIENSPFYHFYTLEKFWEIYQYSLAQHVMIDPSFASILRAMTNFATYILQPDTEVPLLGASIDDSINDFGVYEDIAASDPAFLYVLTHGAKGTPPPRNSVFFRPSGLTVMRSSWQPGPAYARSSYLTYNVGKYRTAHSDLDALAITLYADGGDLLPDAGLYTYSPGPYRDYFHGTASHNTVLVDGRPQAQGDGVAGPLQVKDGLTYQSAESSLYRGVTHRRMVMMIDPRHFLVVDRLSSTRVHDYQQRFHLFPGARISTSGLTVTGVGGSPRRQVTIEQLAGRGITESHVINKRGRHPDGLCSQRYGKLLPCYDIRYSQRGRDATYITLLTIGRHRPGSFGIRTLDHGRRLAIRDGQRRIGLALGESLATPTRSWSTGHLAPAVHYPLVPSLTDAANWSTDGYGTVSSAPASGNTPEAVSLAAEAGSTAQFANDSVRLDLEHHDARLGLDVAGMPALSGVSGVSGQLPSGLRLELSNDHWANEASMNLGGVYTGPGWSNVLLARSHQMGSAGGWDIAHAHFDWSKIDGVRVTFASSAGSPPAVVSLGGLRLLPSQQTGKLVLIFDDGYDSILPAAGYLHRLGLPANVAAIGKYTDYPALGHLNLYQLRVLQDRWGWDIANHSQYDVNAVRTYYDKHRLSGYSMDILRQATWLEAHGLNSAPNWFIYPQGATNPALERIVGRYYMFARTTADDPEAYPYGDPHAVTDFDMGGTGGGSGGYTPPGEVLAAVRGAVASHQTIFLTFHAIHSLADDPPGYPLRLFRQIARGIKRSGISVMTLSQLDLSNGIPVSNHVYLRLGARSQITVRVLLRVGPTG